MCMCICATYLVVLGAAAVPKPVKQEMRFEDLRITLRNQYKAANNSGRKKQTTKTINE